MTQPQSRNDDDTGYSVAGDLVSIRVGGSTHTRTIKEWHELAVASFARSESGTLQQWAEAEKAKADAYEDAARICERMGEPDEGRERHRPGSDEEWASIKLEDAAKAIRERKAKVCHVTQAVK